MDEIIANNLDNFKSNEQIETKLKEISDIQENKLWQ